MEKREQTWRNLQTHAGELAARFDKLDPESARKEVGEYFRAAFPKWRENPEGNLPLGVLDRKADEEIGAKTQIILLSADTLKKQKVRHPELTQKDYEKAQEAIDEGEKIRQDSRNIAFAMNKLDGLVVIVKATRSRDELYATSVRRLSSEEMKRDGIIRDCATGNQKRRMVGPSLRIAETPHCAPKV